MRDPRLRQTPTSTSADERRAAAVRLLSMVTANDRAEIDRQLVEWWNAVLAQGSLGDEWESVQVENLRVRCSSLPTESQNIGLTAPNTLARRARGEDLEIGALLLGESAGTAIRMNTQIAALDRAVKFLSGWWEAVEVLIERLLDDPPWPGTAETLAPATADLAGLLGRHFDRLPSHEILLEEDKTARECGVAAYFWGRYAELCLNETTLVRLTLLARRSWADVALEADALPHRGLRDDLWLHLYLLEDRDSILALLAAAPVTFAGEAWTGSTSALAALRAATEHVDRVHGRLAQLTRAYQPAPDAHEKLKNFEEREVPTWLKQVADAAVLRSDGRQILLLFALSLIRKELRPPWNGNRQWSSARQVLRAIHEVLIPKPTVNEVKQVANAGGVSSNRTSVDHATYLVASAVLDSAPKDVWDWYRELLLQSDEDLCSQARSWRRALCYESLAERLGRLADPFEEWRDLWKALFVTDRERARFATLDPDALQPSLHLLRVGAELLRQTPSRSGAPQFLAELLAQMRGLLANGARLVSPLQPELAVDAIDVAPRVLGSDWPQVLEPHRLLLSNAKHRLHVATLLLDGGASFGDVEAAVEVAGHRLADSVAELKQSNRMDRNVLRFCEIITAAAEEDERARKEIAP